MTDRDDVPTLTAAHFSRARPATQVFSKKAMADFKSKGGRPKAAVVKTPVTIRLDPDLVEALRQSGDGWQSRVNLLLRGAVLPEVGTKSREVRTAWSRLASQAVAKSSGETGVVEVRKSASRNAKPALRA